MWFWFASLALAGEPSWLTCGASEVAPLTDVALLGAPVGFELRSGYRAERTHPVDASVLVVTLTGAWQMDGAEVTSLPPLDALVVFAPADLGRVEVEHLLTAVHGSGAEVWLAEAAREPPRGVSTRDDVDVWTARLSECAPGRKLLELVAPSCEGVERLWRRFQRSPRCDVGWHRSVPPVWLAPARGVPISLMRLTLDPDEPVYWSGDQTLATLDAYTRWVVAGQRPAGSRVDRGREDWSLTLPSEPTSYDEEPQPGRIETRSTTRGITVDQTMLNALPGAR